MLSLGWKKLTLSTSGVKWHRSATGLEQLLVRRSQSEAEPQGRRHRCGRGAWSPHLLAPSKKKGDIFKPRYVYTLDSCKFDSRDQRCASTRRIWTRIKHPWALETHGPKIGAGRLHGEAICMYNVNHRIIKMGGGCLHGDERLLGRLRYS